MAPHHSPAIHDKKRWGAPDTFTCHESANMRHYLSVFLIMAAVLLFCSPAAGASNETMVFTNTVPDFQRASAVSMAVALPTPTPGSGAEVPGNFTKLDINQMYLQIALKPGEVKGETVTVRNRDSKTVTLRPAVVAMPYGGPNQMDASWVTITPATADVAPGESAKFTISSAVPQDTLRGTYYGMIAFTDEQYPSPYPSPVPNYIHQLGLNVNVITQPIVQVSTLYIADQVRAGEQYRYTVEIKNTGTSAVKLNPGMGSDNNMMYGPYGLMEPVLTDSAFTLSAPPSIPPGENGTVEIAVNVPADKTGYYNGYIDLGIDDPALQQGEGRISMNLNIWTQPEETFIRTFTLDAADSISIELASGSGAYSMPYPAAKSQKAPAREPSFETTLTGPEGVVPVTSVQRVIKGSVSLGGDPMTSPSQPAGAYQETGTQYIVTYMASGKPGTWQLSVLPRNTQNFEYKITLGGAGPSAQKDGAPVTAPGTAISLKNTPAVPAHTVVNGTGQS